MKILIEKEYFYASSKGADPTITADNNLNSVADVYTLLRDGFKDILQELMDIGQTPPSTHSGTFSTMHAVGPNGWYFPFLYRLSSSQDIQGRWLIAKSSEEKIHELVGHEDERTTFHNYCYNRETDARTHENIEHTLSRTKV